MNTGKKIKIIREFRKMTQAELAAAIGLGERAQARIGQYESGYRVPKKETLDEIALALDVNPKALYEPTGKNVEELMQIFFWMEEEKTELLKIFTMQQLPAANEAAELDVYAYHFANGHWPSFPICGLMFNDRILNECMWEWSMRRTELAAGIITREEYFEWKINWPDTCEFDGTHIPKKKWRRSFL